MKKRMGAWIVFFLAVSFACGGCANQTAPNSSVSTTPPKAGTPASSTATPGAATSEKPMYFDREITAADLQGRTLRELSLLRNTIFARAGNPFRKKWLNEYFSAQPWYKPLDKMDDGKLTALDKTNAAFIAEYEAGLPRQELEQRKQKLLKKSDTELSKEDRIELTLLARTLGEPEEGQAAAAAATPLDDPRLLDKLMTVEQLGDYSRRDLRLLRNTVYARRGRPFKSPILQEYFERMKWYHSDTTYTDARLTEIDHKNIKIIASLEEQLGGPLTDSAQMKEEGWFGGA